MTDRAGTTVSKGRRAEDIAARWAESHGLTVKERNWRLHHLEVDIIAEGPLLNGEGLPLHNGPQENYLHIVEVRSRVAGYRTTSSPEDSITSVVAPQLTVDAKKQRFLISAADAYVRLRHIREEVVFDVVSIEFTEDSHILSFYPDAFRPQW